MKITAPQNALDAFVKAALPFTIAPGKGVAPHNTWLLIEADADDNTLTVTAEAANTAIRFDAEGIEVQQSGRMAVVAQSLRTLLSVIPSESSVEIEVQDDHSARFSAGSTDASLPLIPLSSRVQVPAIGVIDRFDKVTLSGKDFVEAFRLGSASRDAFDDKPQLLGVHFSSDGERVRVLSFNGRTASYATAAAEVGENPFQVMLDNKVMTSMLDYIRAGSTIQISVMENKRFVHVFVFDEQGRELYHLRGATVEYPAEDYDADNVLRLIATNMQKSKSSLVVDKNLALKLFNNAERVSSIDGLAGAEKSIEVSVDKESFKVKIKGDSTYKSEIAVTSYSGDAIEFDFLWGLYGKQLSLYPDESQLRTAILERPDGSPLAFLLHTDKWDPDATELPSDYLCLIPLRQKRR